MSFYIKLRNLLTFATRHVAMLQQTYAFDSVVYQEKNIVFVDLRLRNNIDSVLELHKA